MAIDWVADVRKYSAQADEAVVGGIERYCGIALASRDGQLVAFSDKAELATVRDGFLKKKLGLKASDAELDAMIAAVGAQLKGVRQKKRVTVYYLLAEAAGKLDTFVKPAKAPAKPKAEAKPAAKAPAKAKAAPKAETKPAAKPKPAPAPEVKAAAAPTPVAAEPAPAAPAPAPTPVVAEAVAPDGASWVIWAIAGLLLLALLWWALS